MLGQVLEDALKIIREREVSYGDSTANLVHLAELISLWNKARGLASDCITPFDVGMYLVFLKIVRLAQNPQHQDSLTDIAGYVALLGKLITANGGGVGNGSAEGEGAR